MLSNHNSRAAHYQDFFVLPVDSSRMVRVAVGRRRRKYRELRAGGETGALVIVCIGLWPVHLCEKILLVRRPLMVAGARRWFFSERSTLHRANWRRLAVLGMAETRR